MIKLINQVVIRRGKIPFRVPSRAGAVSEAHTRPIADGSLLVFDMYS